MISFEAENQDRVIKITLISNQTQVAIHLIKKNMVIMVLGLPGSGKSYFAGRLAKKINAEYWNSDQIRKEVFPERTYSDSEKKKVYEILLKKMQEAMDREKDVVLDATFYKSKIREPFIMNSKENIAFIEVWADENIIQERLNRTRPYSEADLKVYELLKRQWEPLQQPHLSLRSTNENIDVMLEKAVKYLKNDNSTN